MVGNHDVPSGPHGPRRCNKTAKTQKEVEAPFLPPTQPRVPLCRTPCTHTAPRLPAPWTPASAPPPNLLSPLPPPRPPPPYGLGWVGQLPPPLLGSPRVPSSARLLDSLPLFGCPIHWQCPPILRARRWRWPKTTPWSAPSLRRPAAGRRSRGARSGGMPGTRRSPLFGTLGALSCAFGDLGPCLFSCSCGSFDCGGVPCKTFFSASPPGVTKCPKRATSILRKLTGTLCELCSSPLLIGIHGSNVGMDSLPLVLACIHQCSPV